jgi:hypothetical protein
MKIRTVQQIDRWAWPSKCSITVQAPAIRKGPALKRLCTRRDLDMHLSRLVGLIPGLYEVEALKRAEAPSVLSLMTSAEVFEENRVARGNYRTIWTEIIFLTDFWRPQCCDEVKRAHMAFKKDFTRLGLIAVYTNLSSPFGHRSTRDVRGKAFNYL